MADNAVRFPCTCARVHSPSLQSGATIVDPGGFEGPTSNESLILQCMTRQRHHESSSLLIASQKSFPEIKYQCRYRPAMKLFARYVAMRGERYRFQHFANRTRSRQQLCTALVCEGSLVTNRVGVAPRYVQLYICSLISCHPPPCASLCIPPSPPRSHNQQYALGGYSCDCARA